MQYVTEKEINIYVGLTDMQRRWYKSVLAKDIDAVSGENSPFRAPDAGLQCSF